MTEQNNFAVNQTAYLLFVWNIVSLRFQKKIAATWPSKSDQFLRKNNANIISSGQSSVKEDRLGKHDGVLAHLNQSLQMNVLYTLT